MPGCASLPGIVLLAAAAILLIIVTFSTPSIKSVYYLEAIIGGGGSDRGRRLTFGTLGYCLGNRCSPLKLGYSLTDVNQLFGINIIPEQYSTALIKGLTYTLILQPVAAILTLIALLFAILSACPGCGCGAFCGSFLTGLAASITLLAFALDLALFVIARKRINDISGASATLGNALWIVAAAWACLVVGAILVCCGACCGGSGGSGRKRDKWEHSRNNTSFGGGGGGGPAPLGGGTDYNNNMRMDALAAERDRKQRQAAYDRGRRDGESNLPQFAEYVTEHEVPLKQDYDDSFANSHHQQQGGAYANYYDAGAPHHRQQSSTAGYQQSYVPGVGPGYGAGRGATPVDAAQEFYTPGEGPQPFHDGHYATGGGAAGYHDAGYAAAAGAGVAYAATAGRGAHGQTTHPDDPSGGTAYYSHPHQDQSQYLEDPGYGGGSAPGAAASTYPQYGQHYADAGSHIQSSSRSPAPSSSQQPPSSYPVIDAAPIPPPGPADAPSRALPGLPVGSPAPPTSQLSEKQQLQAHYEAQDAAAAGGSASNNYYGQPQQQHQPSMYPGSPISPSHQVAHLESMVSAPGSSVSGAGQPHQGASDPSGPPGYDAGGHHQQQQQQHNAGYGSYQPQY
ncbi:hypothetical protein OC845_000349 [Tilletia horrida]|nr:hypothetical protein OC845_000349 [Tilletia horrida]